MMGPTSREDVLVQASKLLRQQAPVAEVLATLNWKHHDWISDQAQAQLHATLLCDPVHDVFPLATWYKASFIRRLCTVLEEAIAESQDGDLAVIEPILRELNQLLGRTTPKTADPGELATCFLTFECPIVVPKGAEHITQTLATRTAPKENAVGLKVWEACYVCADALLAHPELCEGQHIIELGAGVGLLGLVTGYCLGASRVTMTDVDAQVLLFLRANVEANAAAAAAQGRTALPVIEVAALDWTNKTDCQKLLESSTEGLGRTIIAADCIYDRTVIPDLVQLLSLALRQSELPTRVLVASTTRDPETYAYYEQVVAEKGLIMENVTESLVPANAVASSPFYCPNRAAVRLCTISLKDDKQEKKQ